MALATVRIENVIMEPNKHIVMALQNIFGIGPTLAKQICSQAELVTSRKVKDLDEEAITRIQNIIKTMGYVVEGNLRRKVSMDIKRLRDINCYRGRRHKQGLPVRGQRTRTNARTRKGPTGKKMVTKPSDKKA